jgi:flavin-dependent dehydrogenase
VPPSAIVIGGGPAGSLAATLLARRGWAVTLIEQHRFPRDKVCGECLSALAGTVLDRAGLLKSVLSLGAVRLTRTLLHAPSGVRVDVPLPSSMWGVSRRVFDELLLDAAARAGARVWQPGRCESITPGRRPSVRVRDLVTNRVETVEADVVLLADGKSALLPGGPPPPSGDLGIKTHFENVDGPRDAIELFGLAGCYGGLAAIEGGRWNLALSVPAARARHFNGDLSNLFAALIANNPTLRLRLAAARQVGPWLASPLPRFAVRWRWPAGVIPLGNAAAALEPIGGEGMGLAMRSAEIAADVLSRRGADDGALSGDVRQRYQHLWRPRALGCRAAAVATSSTVCARGLARALAPVPGALRPVLRLIGK